MNLFKLDERMKALGLSEKQREEIMECVRDFAAELTRRLLWL